MIRFFSSRVSSRTVGQAPLRLRRLLPTFMLVLVMGGLVFQALQGDRGLRGWQELRAKNKERAIALAGLEEENAELKKMFADVSLENHAIKELFAKKIW